MRTIALSAIAILGLAGCGTLGIGGDPEITNATPQSITFAYRGQQSDEAMERAQNHCRSFDRSARLQAVTGTDRKVATFDCV